VAGEHGLQFAPTVPRIKVQKSVHVIACEDGWAVEENGEQVSVRHTRAQAEQIARAFATGTRAELVVHARDGHVERVVPGPRPGTRSVD